MKKGFTLIELLVTISIIGILAGLVINNLADARLRARDTARKAGLREMKTALRLYYNDHQSYPANSATIGNPGAIFQEGTTTYMKQLPEEWAYTRVNADAFILKATLENASDSDLLTSQTRCPGQAYADTDYVVCED